MKPKSPFELHESRLGTTDESGDRVYLYPTPPPGKYRTRRRVVAWALIALFLSLPWLTIFGKPLMLLDIQYRKFTLLGVTFWAHEIPTISFILIAFTLLVTMITAVWGRLWCGWACPQTVFIDFVFRPIEIFFEGDSVQRRALDAAPWNFEKFWKRGLKWSSYVLLAMVIAHSFVAYFTGPARLGQMILEGPFEHQTAFGVAMFMVFGILWDFGWFREQFCIIACPYGRFQAVMMDQHSMSVLYDEKRGEPRRGMDAEKQGDCINCYRCVQVCPTGIDIRRGVQLECIACTACMDACDEVMTRIKKPTGLIRYDTESAIVLDHAERELYKPSRLRARMYFGLMVVMLSAVVLRVALREPIGFFVRNGKDPYHVISEKQVSNHFHVAIHAQASEDMVLQLRARDRITGAELQVIQAVPFPVLHPGESFHGDFFILFDRTMLREGNAEAELLMRVEESDGDVTEMIRPMQLLGPF